jgi:1,2-dihydroxy-3-keto-5-methylthiopentene dioxygenase
MAKLMREDGTVLEEPADVAKTLGILGIELKFWPVNDTPGLEALLAKTALSDGEKDQVLTALEPYFQQLKKAKGYQARDLVVLHPDVPNLEAMLAKFDKVHTHSDDEVRYIIDGEGVFGFVLPDGRQVELTVETGDYINVPADTEHWFHLTEKRRIKAVRYFTSAEGWVANYTGTPVRMGRVPA